MTALAISEITIHRITPENRPEGSPLLGFARIVFNGEFVVNGIRIVEGRFGPFISFPREHDRKTDRKIGICYPITKDLETAVTARVLQEFGRAA